VSTIPSVSTKTVSLFLQDCVKVSDNDNETGYVIIYVTVLCSAL